RPGSGPSTARRCASRSAGSTGPVPSSPQCGPATWTARCSPVNGPRPRGSTRPTGVPRRGAPGQARGRLRRLRRGPVLDERHDFAHPVEGDQAWSESYYFNAYDPVTDSGFFTRIGVRPNDGTMDVGMSVWLPGGDLAEYRFVTEQ